MSQTAKPAPIRRRGPSPTKTAGTRRNILAAALATFLKKGFAETRMVDVAKEAGVAKGTLYLYFVDKQALFEGMMHEVIASPVARLAALEPGPDETVRAFLSRVVGPIMATMESSGRSGVIRLVITEMGRFPSVGEAYRREVLDPVVAFVRRVAAAALARGEIRSDAPVRFPQLLMAPGLVTAIWNHLHDSGDRLNGGELFDAWLDLVFGEPRD